MNFHFPLMPRMFMSLHLENSFPILDIMAQTPEIPESCQWAVFLRNHDELTLEMVTDEDRDYMYRVYADDPQARINLGIRRRLGPLLKSRRGIELLNGLLFSLPGTPVLYYGDEIGMGDNIYLGDRDGVRTPMQWSSDRNAGFSRSNPQKLYLPLVIDPEYHYESVNVEAQQNNPESLLWWMKHLIELRKQHEVFGRGRVEFLHPDNGKVLAFVRSNEHEHVLVLANLSRFPQGVELDLQGFEGHVPLELFGRSRFPAVTDGPYFLSLAGHAFYWFLLEAPKAAVGETEPEELRVVAVRGDLQDLFRGATRRSMLGVMAERLPRRRWFRSKGREIKSVEIADVLPIPRDEGATFVVILDVAFFDGEQERYLWPVWCAFGLDAERLAEEHPGDLIARLVRRDAPEGAPDREGVVIDAVLRRALRPGPARHARAAPHAEGIGRSHRARDTPRTAPGGGVEGR